MHDQLNNPHWKAKILQAIVKKIPVDIIINFLQANLICYISSSWNTDLVGALFNEQEAKQVLNMALLTGHGEDEMAWDRSRNNF